MEKKEIKNPQKVISLKDQVHSSTFLAPWLQLKPHKEFLSETLSQNLKVAMKLSGKGTSTLKLPAPI